jgi:hypothetical protein
VLTTTYSVLGFCGGIGDQELLILTFVHFLSVTKLQDIECGILKSCSPRYFQHPEQ